jgi:hypothetical protein
VIGISREIADARRNVLVDHDVYNVEVYYVFTTCFIAIEIIVFSTLFKHTVVFARRTTTALLQKLNYLACNITLLLDRFCGQNIEHEGLYLSTL